MPLVDEFVTPNNVCVVCGVPFAHWLHGQGARCAECSEAVYGRKPASPRSASLLSNYIRERSTDSKVEVIDMGKGQEYEFRHGEADQWPKEARATGLMQLKAASWDGWWKLYLARRKKHHSRPDGRHVEEALPRSFGESVWLTSQWRGKQVDLWYEGDSKAAVDAAAKKLNRALGQQEWGLDMLEVEAYLSPTTKKHMLSVSLRALPRSPTLGVVKKAIKTILGSSLGKPQMESSANHPQIPRKSSAIAIANHLQTESGEPGDGRESADSAKAKTLAKSFLKDRTNIALLFRQLWRHKYAKGNYDASKAWKLFYWPLTHSGAGGKGYGPATRKVAAKLLVGEFNKWAKADMKITVSRTNGKEEKPAGSVSRAEFIKWFVGGAR